jgi:hypothetical protein
MTHDVFRFSLGLLLVSFIALGCSIGRRVHERDAAWEDRGSKAGREADPVVITGNFLGPLVGRDPEKLVAFRYRDSWDRVPVQVDERVVVDLADVYGFTRFGAACVAPQLSVVPCYADINTLVGPDTDPAIDSDDEIVFMFQDGGQRPAAFQEPKGVKAGSGVEVRVSEPGKKSETRYLYLFASDGSLDPEAEKRYGQYSFSLDVGDYPANYNFCGGGNPEDSWFKSESYERHFSDRWLSDVIKILASGSTGVDLLDEQYVTSPALGTCTSDTDAFVRQEGAFVNIKSGPVRSIRSFLGAQSAAFTQRTHLFYERREDIIDNFRVHALGAGTMDLFDYSKEAVGMTYYDSVNLPGLAIDGVDDDFETTPVSSADLSYHNAWKLITGPQGSMVMIDKIDTDIVDLKLSHFYSDQSPGLLTPCRGDDSYYGATGSRLGELPCTETFCENYFVSSRTIYYSGPGSTVDEAIQAAKNIYTPLTIEVTSEGIGHNDYTDTIEKDASADGGIEAGADESTVCHEIFSLDKNGDGREDESWAMSYDRGGNGVEEWDKNADGTVDARWTVTYQDHGRIVTEEWDDGADGAVDARRINTSECYTVAGISGGQWRCDVVKSETDRNGDNKIDEIWSLEYGHIPSTEFEERRLLEEKWDQNADGTVDQKWEASWYDNGQLEKVISDKDADGNPDEVLVYAWENKVYSIPNQQWDKNGDGEAEEEIRYLFDLNNSERGPTLTRAERYRGNDRVAGEYRYYSSDHESGLMGSSGYAIEWDENGDGIAEERLNYNLDVRQEEVVPGGSMVSSYVSKKEWIRGADGNVDEIVTETYDQISDKSYYTKLAWDRDSDGTDDEFCIEYSEEGMKEFVIECDTDRDQRTDWQLKSNNYGNCANRPSNKYDQLISNVTNSTIFDAFRPSAGLSKERADTPKLAPKFERVRDIGTYQTEDECYDCYW